jgi:hypothetical protein
VRGAWGSRAPALRSRPPGDRRGNPFSAACASAAGSPIGAPRHQIHQKEVPTVADSLILRPVPYPVTSRSPRVLSGEACEHFASGGKLKTCLIGQQRIRLRMPWRRRLREKSNSLIRNR